MGRVLRGPQVREVAGPGKGAGRPFEAQAEANAFAEEKRRRSLEEHPSRVSSLARLGNDLSRVPIASRESPICLKLVMDGANTHRWVVR